MPLLIGEIVTILVACSSFSNFLTTGHEEDLIVNGENVGSYQKSSYIQYDGVFIGRATIKGTKLGPNFKSLVVAMPNGRYKLIRKLSDFKGHVHILTSAQALAFARIDSLPSTFFLFDNANSICEVVPRAYLDKRTMPFTTSEMRKYLTAASNGDLGIIAQPWQGLPKTQVTRDTTQVSSFLVSRVVVKELPNIFMHEYAIYLVTQKVNKDGGISTLSEVRMTQSQSIRWNLRTPSLFW